MKLEIIIDDDTVKVAAEGDYKEVLGRVMFAVANIIKRYSDNKAGYKTLKRACVRKLKSTSWNEVCEVKQED